MNHMQTKFMMSDSKSLRYEKIDLIEVIYQFKSCALRVQFDLRVGEIQ